MEKPKTKPRLVVDNSRKKMLHVFFMTAGEIAEKLQEDFDKQERMRKKLKSIDGGRK
jgi:DNA replication protein DnaC